MIPQLLSVARGRSEDQCEVARMTGCDKAALKSKDQLVRNTNSDKSRDSDCLIVLNDSERFIRRDDLVLQLHDQAPVVLASPSLISFPEPVV